MPWPITFIGNHFGQGSHCGGGSSSFCMLSNAGDDNDGADGVGGGCEEVEEEEEEGVTGLLLDECLASIFQKLSAADRNSCALVCRRWHRVDANSRHRLALRSAEALLAVPSMLFRFTFLTSLSLKGSRKGPGNDTLNLIGERCARLTRLKLASCRAITDDGLTLFSKSTVRLKKFSCSSCSFGAPGLNALLNGCGAELEDLSLKRLKQLTAPLEPVQSKLRRLCLKGLSNNPLITPLLIASKHLRILIASKNFGDWDPLLETISENAPDLTEVHLESMHLTDKGLSSISKCANLEVLRVIKASDCSDIGLCSVADGCRKLRKLHLDDGRLGRISDRGLLAIATKCTELRELVLIRLQVTTASLGLIASNCKGLERMALCSSAAVGDAELSCIAEKCFSLKKLCIKNCPISDLGLEFFANGCPNLSKMKVKKCRNVTGSTALLLRMNRASLIISLDDDPNEIQTEEEMGRRVNNGVIIPASTSSSSSSHSLESRITAVARSFLRRFRRSS